MKKLLSFTLLVCTLVSCWKTEDTTEVEAETQTNQTMEPLESSDFGGGGEWAPQSWTR